MADIGTGTTFTCSAYSANLLDVNWTGISRPSVKTSHMGSTVDTFVPGDLEDWGELQLTAQFSAAALPPVTSTTTSGAVAFPDGSTWTADMFCVTADISDPMEDVMTIDTTWKVTGLPVVS